MPILKPTGQEIRATVEGIIRSHNQFLNTIRSFGINVPGPGASLLEIGFISEGYSIFAFERMGYCVHGVDNYYSGMSDESPLPDYLSRELNSSATFSSGDICGGTPYEDEALDIVYSSSVLEHVSDLRSAFKEMRRILKPGGLIIHSYHPFYSVNGGHALGILDSPWGHLRLTQDDYIRYLCQLRPCESKAAVDWVTKALYPVPMATVQRWIVEAGFDLMLWRMGGGSKGLHGLTTDVMRDALQQHPNISVQELTYQNIVLVARKCCSSPI